LSYLAYKRRDSKHNVTFGSNYLSLEHSAESKRGAAGVVDTRQMIMHQSTFMIVLARCGQVIHVSSHTIGRRERDDGDARCVGVDGEIGQQLLDKLELVVEVGGTDARALVD